MVPVRGDGEGGSHKSEVARSWPVLAGLVVQALVFAYFVGGLSTKVDIQTAAIEKLATKEGVLSVSDRVNKVDGRVDELVRTTDRLDRRVSKVELVQAADAADR